MAPCDEERGCEAARHGSLVGGGHGDSMGGSSRDAVAGVEGGRLPVVEGARLPVVEGARLPVMVSRSPATKPVIDQILAVWHSEPNLASAMRVVSAWRTRHRGSSKVRVALQSGRDGTQSEPRLA